MNRTGRSTPAAARSTARSTARSAARSVRITSAHTSHSERIHGRQTRYLISMGVRTVCFILAVATDGTLRWVFIAAAVVLPYFAVIAANAGGEVDRGAPDPFHDDSRLMLETGATGGVREATHGPADGPTQGDRAAAADEGKYRQSPLGIDDL
jgi:hypothetical protein